MYFQGFQGLFLSPESLQVTNRFYLSAVYFFFSSWFSSRTLKNQFPLNLIYKNPPLFWGWNPPQRKGQGGINHTMDQAVRAVTSRISWVWCLVYSLCVCVYLGFLGVLPQYWPDCRPEWGGGWHVWPRCDPALTWRKLELLINSLIPAPDQFVFMKVPGLRWRSGAGHSLGNKTLHILSLTAAPASLSIILGTHVKMSHIVMDY